MYEALQRPLCRSRTLNDRGEVQQAFASCQTAHSLSVYCHKMGAEKLGTELSYWQRKVWEMIVTIREEISAHFLALT